MTRFGWTTTTIAPLLCAATMMMMLWIGGGGCAQDEGTALDREAFYRPPAGTRADRHTLQDEPGPLMYDQVRMDLLSPDQRVGVPGLDRLRVGDQPPAPAVTSVSENVRETIRLPSGAGRAGPAVGVPSGVAVTIGSVVCEVNGTPIYADKVLASLEKVFAAEAKRRNPRDFRAYARKEVENQVTLFVEAELAFAAAKKNLTPAEQSLADAYTMRWRNEQITQAGGSIERARAKAAAEGRSFEELVDEQHRLHMVQVYYQKRLMPRAQVRADDMRRYYNQHLHAQFTEPAQAQFRVIRIDAGKTGSVEAARDKIENLRARAARGEDFAEMARTVNDDPNLMRLAGDVGWLRQGSFAIDAVEEAVWKLEPGEVSDVVQVGDSFYIARLENKKPGRVRAFEEDAVQAQIEKALKNEMLMSLRAREREALLSDAIVYPDPPLYDVVIEMAMQKYPAWASGAASAQ